MPLSGNDHDNDHGNEDEDHLDNEEQSDQTNTNSRGTTSGATPNEPLIDLGNEAAAQGDTHGDHLGVQIIQTSISGTTLSTTTHSRSLAQAQLSSSKVSSGSPSSSSTSFQFPRFVKHKSLLGLKERLQNPNPNSSSSSSYTRLFSSKSQGADLSSYYSSDLAHIRPKQTPHTTLSGPREIQKSQKRKVLQEIRPDPYNLPVELLREQAKSGAVANGLTPGSVVDHTGQGGASGNSMRGERGTLLGS
ncbi:hypothetical protein BG000_003935, partial [Podila horticola]